MEAVSTLPQAEKKSEVIVKPPADRFGSSSERIIDCGH